MGWEDIKRKGSDKQEEIENSPNALHYRDWRRTVDFG